MISVTFMPLLVSKSASRSKAEELDLQGSAQKADGEARRLAAAAARGDEAAFQHLYDLYHDRLFRLALVLGRGDQMLAQETVQSVFVTAAAKLRRVAGEEHLWNWLARVARQQVAKVRRQQGSADVRFVELSEVAAPQPESILEESLDAALLTMDSDDQQLIEWFYFDKLAHIEIAERLNTTPKTVSSRMERARAKLRLLVTQKLSHET